MQNAMALPAVSGCTPSHLGGCVLTCSWCYYLFPFLSNHPQHQPADPRPAEFLRLTALGVIGAFWQNLVPLCLRADGLCSELSRTVATFVVQKVLQDPAGLPTWFEQGYARVWLASGVRCGVNPSARLFEAQLAKPESYLAQSSKTNSLLSRMQLQLARIPGLDELHWHADVLQQELGYPPHSSRFLAPASRPASGAHHHFVHLMVVDVVHQAHFHVAADQLAPASRARSNAASRIFLARRRSSSGMLQPELCCQDVDKHDGVVGVANVLQVPAEYPGIHKQI
uniref:CCR4-NOT transcription complex subunit 9 n=1 Tax=Macrostomum lignano TaxID=282301 RepID=A0A1I8FNU0_9PLAT